jgi:hypothetical protein
VLKKLGPWHRSLWKKPMKAWESLNKATKNYQLQVKTYPKRYISWLKTSGGVLSFFMHNY